MKNKTIIPAIVFAAVLCIGVAGQSWAGPTVTPKAAGKVILQRDKAIVDRDKQIVKLYTELKKAYKKDATKLYDVTKRALAAQQQYDRDLQFYTVDKAIISTNQLPPVTHVVPVVPPPDVGGGDGDGGGGYGGGGDGGGNYGGDGGGGYTVPTPVVGDGGGDGYTAPSTPIYNGDGGGSGDGGGGG